MHANATPIINNQPVNGSNNTSKIPNPNPIKHTPMVFFNKLNMFSSLSFIYLILYLFYLFLFM